MATLFMENVPYNCSDVELVNWVRDAGLDVKSVRIIRDTVAGVSPSFAYVDITETVPIADAVTKLDRHFIRDRAIHVCAAKKGRTAA